MEPILNLSPQEFRAALAELQLDPQREADLVRLYEEANAPQQGGRDRGMLRNLLDNIIGFDDEVVTPGERLGAGAEQFASGLLSDPLGMAGDIAQGGYETIERAMAPGATPMDVMGAAGMAMLGGGMVTGPRGALRSGLLRDAADETPAQQVARLLREGRADEVTDDLMAQADPQEMFRLYEAGETGMDLPMDVQSRMRRAEDMGFDMMADLYHGSARDGFVDTTDIKAFDPSRVGDRWNADTQGFSMTTAQRDANYYAQPGDSAIRRGDFGDGVVYPLMDASQRPLQMRVGPLDGTISAWDNRPSDTYDVINRGGYDSARLNADGVEMRVVMDPSNIRSRFARFDPRLSHLSNLNAANVDPLTGAVAVSASQQDDPLANLKAYIAAAGGVLPR